MTIKELKEQLQRYDENSEVAVCLTDNGYFDILNTESKSLCYGGNKYVILTAGVKD